jgi:hypothetical protein
MSAKFEIVDLEDRIAPSLFGLLNDVSGLVPDVDASASADVGASANVLGIISIDADAHADASVGL